MFALFQGESAGKRITVEENPQASYYRAIEAP
jgi:hypothetical protein